MNESVRVDNLLKLLRKGRFELTGEEALAFSQCFQYLIEKQQALKAPVGAIQGSPSAPKLEKVQMPIKKKKG